MHASMGLGRARKVECDARARASDTHSALAAKEDARRAHNPPGLPRGGFRAGQNEERCCAREAFFEAELGPALEN